jgi:hypothetical protein
MVAMANGETIKRSNQLAYAEQVWRFLELPQALQNRYGHQADSFSSLSKCS